MAFVARTFYRKLLLVISLVQHQIAQAFSGCGFVGRVDIEAFVRFHEIVRADDAAVRNPFDGLSLSLAQKRCLALFRRISVFVWSDLDAIERYVADCDFISPVFYHCFKTFGIGLICRYVGASLIPEDTFVSIVFDRNKHRIVHQHRAQIVDHRLYVFRVKRYVGICLKQLSWRPALNLGAAIGCAHNTDGHIEYIAHPFGQMPCQSAEFGSCFR